MNPFIYDLRTYKYKFIQAYFHFQLLQAERLKNEGKGKLCVIEEDIVATSVQKIIKIIEDNNNTYEDVIKTIKYNPPMREYYNVIGNTVKKHFTVGKGWIPSFLAIEVLRIFDEKGYTTFKEIDFLTLQGYYQKHENRKENDLITHYKCAEDIYNSIMDKKIFRKKRKK